MFGALQRCLEECLRLITLSVIGNRFAVVAVEIRPPPARIKIRALACYALRYSFQDSNMADAWWEDLKLREDMERYVRQGYKREEALDFLKRDFPMYAWRTRSLDRRLRYFEIYYNNPEVSVEEVKDAVKKELEGSGKLLGYRAMHKKVRQEYNLHVTRDAVYNVMYDLDPEGLEARGGIGAKKKRKKGNFSLKGPNFVHSLDGHAK